RGRFLTGRWAAGAGSPRGGFGVGVVAADDQVLAHRGVPAGVRIVAAHHFPGHARDDAVVRVLAGAHHRARRDHAVAAQGHAGQDHRVRADPGARADADRSLGGPLVPDRGVGVGVAVVLVGDVDVGAGEDVV